VRDYGRFDEYVAQRMPGWTDELVEFCRIPSEAADSEALRDALTWIAERLRRLGATVEVLELDGTPPLVVGEIGDGPRTLVCVHHYDVQPSAPLEPWTSPPYEPAIRNGALYARGASDDKGELLVRIWALEAHLATLGELPCRVRFLVEGEEESGSPRLDALLDLRPELRRADGALAEGGYVDDHGAAWIECGAKGMLAIELSLHTIAYDAHSSLSPLLPNAALRMARALASLYDTEGRPAFDGWNEGVIAPTPEQVALVDALPAAEFEDMRRVYQVERLVGGLDGVTASRANTFDPTCNIQGLWSGYTGPGMNNIVPAEAHARIDLRLVPQQDPEVLLARLRAHFDSAGFQEITMRVVWAEAPYWSSPSDPIVGAAARAAETVLGVPSIVSVSAAGTAPMAQVCAANRVPVATIGGVHGDSRPHGPNENYRLDLAEKAVRIMARFVGEFARVSHA
jgi:acetylornithine deacetylase/succinyl-diaminopimelate desuccinylase-like protein